MDVSFDEYNPSVKFERIMVLRNLGSGSSVSSTAFDSEFQEERQHLLLEPGQFEDIPRVVRTNLRVWFYISGLGTNYLSAVRHKTKRHQTSRPFLTRYGKVTTYKLHLNSDF
jgi:hypothetical protein